jgi:hypothetical protein
MSIHQSKMLKLPNISLMVGTLLVLSLLVYSTISKFLNHCPPTSHKEAQRYVKDVSTRLEVLPSRSIETGTHCLCSSTYSNLFKKDAVQNAIDSRKNWTKSLPFTIESQHLKHGNSLSPEQEYPFSHERFDMLGPIVPHCKFKESYGKGDEEKRACGLKVQLQGSNCTILSLGSNDQWDFERSIFEAIPNCKIHTFDCTVRPSVEPPADIRSRTKLHRVCIGSEDKQDNGTPFMSWKSVMKLVDTSEPPLYLKMDIEGYEYQVLRSIIDGGFLMPIQIAFELHYATFMEGLPWYGRRKSSGEIAAFMEYLHHQGGYFLLDRHDNPYCDFCTELLVTRLPCVACPK